MLIRKYRNYGITESAKEIICECISRGSSKGWAGSEEELEAVSEICNKYNVFYVCDFNGEWAHRTPKED